MSVALIGSYYLGEAQELFYLEYVIFSCYSEIHGMAYSRIVEMCLDKEPVNPDTEKDQVANLCVVK